MIRKNISSRNIGKSDITAIRGLVERSGSFVIPYDMYAYWILGSYFKTTCRVAVDKGSIIGYISGLPCTDGKTMFIWQLCVDEAYRKSGIGYRLIDEIISAARESKYTRIEFSVGDNNTASYRLSKKYADDNSLTMKELSREKVGESVEIVLCYEL